MKACQASRRRFLTVGGAAIVAIPAGLMVGQAAAAPTPAVAKIRAQLKYRDTPEGDKNCLNCIQFVPGKTPTALGGCKVIPGDTEIAPQGWCIVWAPIKK